MPHNDEEILTEQTTDINDDVEDSVFSLDFFHQPSIIKYCIKVRTHKQYLYIGLSSLTEKENPLLPPPEYC